MISRRRFLAAAGAAALFPGSSLAQPAATPRFADMHAHLGFRQQESYRARMEKGAVLIVAEKITPDGPLIRLVGNKLRATREAKPGEMRRGFEVGLGWRRSKAKEENLAIVDSPAALDRVLAERTPALVISAEGADFVESDLGYVERIRAQGLVHLQIVHYYGWSGIGDIATEAPVHKGLSTFGKDMVRACNRLGMLVDIAHCSHPAMDQVLEISTKPVVYSHGHVSAGMPDYNQSGSVARAIQLETARRVAEKGGVIGFWTDWHTFANLDLMADALMRVADQIGPRHVGIGSDMHGLVRTCMPSYAGFPELEELLAQRKLPAADIAGILGGNYLRVLREAMSV